jgi:MGT family glycosyltransferase
MANELARERPDVAVADYFLLGAVAAAERAGVPTAVLVHNAMYPGPVRGLPPPGTGFSPARHAADHLRDRAWAAALRRVAIRDALPSLNRARANLGLNPLRSPFDQYDAAARVLILSSHVFDFGSDRLPSNVRYVGTPFDEATPAPWRSPWSADDRRPLLLVSLSTLNQGQGPVMHKVLKAIAELPVRALVTLGPSLAQHDFKAPPNATLEAFVPHNAVLPGAAAVVTQGGLSTVTKALAHGLPLVCIPLVADQPDNAARIVAAGAGIRLSPRSTTARIAAAIERVLVEKRFREGARRMAVLMGLERGADTAADELETLATGRGA